MTDPSTPSQPTDLSAGLLRSARCTARVKRTGEQCRNLAIRGATVCRMHGGSAPAVRRAAARRVAEAEAAQLLATLGRPVDVAPTEALLEEVRWTAGHVAWLRDRVAGLDPELLTYGTVEERSSDDGVTRVDRAGANAWYQLYAAERDRLVRVCDIAVRAGVEERRVRLAEQQGDLVAGAIRAILEQLQLTPAQQQLVPAVVPRVLRGIVEGRR